jgi:hypothetical protein
MCLVPYANLAVNTRIVSDFPLVESSQTKGLSRNVIGGWMQAAFVRIELQWVVHSIQLNYQLFYYDLFSYCIPEKISLSSPAIWI